MKSPASAQTAVSWIKPVQTEVGVDVYKTVGGWKNEPNSTVGVVDGKQFF